MNVLEARLAVQDVLILDGALATELEARGFSVDDPLWSAKALFERPDLVREIHLDYLRAGADVLTSASYQATIAGFMRRGFTAEEAAELLRRSVRLAQEARDLHRAECGGDAAVPLVAASVGPYGAYLADGSEYRGDYDVDEEALTAFHAPRLRILASAAPDLLACETLPCLSEACAIVRALRAEGIRIPAYFSFSCRDGAHISDGTEIAACARVLDAVPEAVAIGVNCTAPKYVSDLIHTIRQETNKPIVVYPNSGEYYDAATQMWRGTAEDFGTRSREYAAAGARIIGGCCRTTPRDTAAIAAWVKGGRKWGDGDGDRAHGGSSARCTRDA